MRSGGLRGMGMWMRANLGGTAGKRAVINQMRTMAHNKKDLTNPFYQNMMITSMNKGIGGIAGKADKYITPQTGSAGIQNFENAFNRAKNQANIDYLKRYNTLTNQAYNWSGAKTTGKPVYLPNGELLAEKGFKTGFKDNALKKQALNFNTRVNGGANYKVPNSFSTPAVNPNQFKDVGGLKLMGAGIAGSMGVNYLFGNNNQNTTNTPSTQYNY